MNWWNSSKMDQNSSNLLFFIGNSRTFLFKTQEIIENSTFRKNKFPDLPEKVRNDKPEIHISSFQTSRTRSLRLLAFWAMASIIPSILEQSAILLRKWRLRSSDDVTGSPYGLHLVTFSGPGHETSGLRPSAGGPHLHALHASRIQ